MGGFDYVSKTGKIYVVSLTTSWAQVLTAAQTKGIRGVKVKSRITFDASGGMTAQPGPFDIAFTSSPSAGADSSGTGFSSYGGAGFGDTVAPLKGLWAKSAVSGTLLEIIVYE